MPLSKSTRIIILLCIDSAFCLLELTVGYGVHSLALIADAFHMLNDVLSLCVGLWAVKIAHGKPSSMYTYGWQRAETLGALVNGVFLVALCMSIFLEAMQRFFEPQVVSDPKLVFVVGCMGLLSNIIGLFLFHEHGHSHGGDSHGHSHESATTLSAAEEGRNNGQVRPAIDRLPTVADESGNIADVLPQTAVAGWPKSGGLSKTPSGGRGSKHRSKGYSRSDEEDSTMTNSTSPLSFRKSSGSNGSHRRHRRRHGSGSLSRYSTVDEIHVHPASFRNEIIAASRLDDIESREGSESGAEEAAEDPDFPATEESPLLGRDKPQGNGSAREDGQSPVNQKAHERHDSWHIDHKHNKAKEEGKSGHSHGNLNMKGVFLHVVGDALGNIGVIVSALIIQLSSWPGRFYADPAISLIITFIILGSAIPLCRAASRILLQGVPAGISVDDIKDDINELPGIVDCHHLHVWQLSDTKLVASLHIQVEFDFKEEGSARYMQLARAVRRCLHEYGIHSSTIQPEFCLDSDHRHLSAITSDNEEGSVGGAAGNIPRTPSKPASLRSQPEACLLDCGDECDEGGQCCAPANMEADGHDANHSH